MIRKGIIVVMTLAAMETTALWIRSHWLMDFLSVPTSTKWFLSFSSRLGAISLGHCLDSDRNGTESVSFESGDVTPWIEATMRMQEAFAAVFRLTRSSARIEPDPSFRYQNNSVTYRGRTFEGRSVTFPHWLLAILFAAYPTIAFIRGPLRRYRRRRKGLCLKCGYNLTGNTTGVCSECGVEIKL